MLLKPSIVKDRIHFVSIFKTSNLSKSNMRSSCLGSVCSGTRYILQHVKTGLYSAQPEKSTSHRLGGHDVQLLRTFLNACS